MNSKERAYFIKKNRATTSATSIEQHESFRAYLQAKNIVESTIEKYIHQLEKYVFWLKTNKEKEADQAESKDILAYLQHLQESLNYATRSRTQVLGILRHYYTFLHQNAHTAHNPTTLIKLRGTPKRTIQKLLSIDELNELLDTYYQLKVKDAKLEYKHFQHRNYFILSLCVYQGLTLSEWKNLTLEDINLQQATLTVQARRKSNGRTLELQASQMGILYEYLYNTRKEFPTQNGLLINSNPEVQNLALAIKKMYPKFTDFKQVRASIITHWIRIHGLRKAQYNAGHRYISSTEEYLWGDLESLKNDINSFHPL
jgi:site-specific recombinase XerD